MSGDVDVDEYVMDQVGPCQMDRHGACITHRAPMGAEAMCTYFVDILEICKDMENTLRDSLDEELRESIAMELNKENEELLAEVATGIRDLKCNYELICRCDQSLPPVQRRRARGGCAAGGGVEQRMKFNIEIDMATLGFEQDEDTGELVPTADLIGRVAEVIAQQHVSRYKIEEIVAREVRQIASDQASAIVAEVLSGAIHRTDAYGNRRGETTTVRAMVMEEVEKWMRLPGRDGYNTTPTMGDALKKMVDELLHKELKPTVDAAKKALQDRVIKLAVEGAAEKLAKAQVI